MRASPSNSSAKVRRLLRAVSPDRDQEAFAFIADTRKELQEIASLPFYSWSQKGELFQLLDGKRKKVRFPAETALAYFEPPIRLGKVSLVSVGTDDANKTLYRIDGLKAEKIENIGWLEAYPEMDQRKVHGFVPRDSLAMWHPENRRSVIFDVETGDLAMVDGIVEIRGFFRSPTSHSERILVVRQTGLYSSDIPRSDSAEALLWDSSGVRHFDRVPIGLFQGEAPRSVLTDSGETHWHVVSVCPGAPEDSIGMDFSGKTWVLEKPRQSDQYRTVRPYAAD